MLLGFSPHTQQNSISNQEIALIKRKNYKNWVADIREVCKLPPRVQLSDFFFLSFPSLFFLFFFLFSFLTNSAPLHSNRIQLSTTNRATKLQSKKDKGCSLIFFIFILFYMSPSPIPYWLP